MLKTVDRIDKVWMYEEMMTNDDNVMIWKEFSRVPDIFYIYQTWLLL